MQYDHTTREFDDNDIESSSEPPPLYGDRLTEYTSNTTLAYDYATPIENRISNETLDAAATDQAIMGTYRGPPVVIHRHEVATRLLQCVFIMWLLSGFAFLTCIMLCVLVSVGYVAFHSDRKLPNIININH
jgi:hypothetical protein